ncbi:dipeptide epimerase [Desulfopila sp. IMCC35008]|uniref:dipeptide epimerase n=1 Tax=Desulfopila sp. IMCC35008 TaxID=2653858 RepID=UPI0013D6B17E|nr:dipeptide epimerase [Desulfopila sp. IMCC35008]
MKLTDITSRTVSIPLSTPFRTALRTVTSMENVLVEVHSDSGLTGFGSAAPATVITGETVASITGGVDHLRDHLRGMDITAYEALFNTLNDCIIGCMSAKAAVDIAIHDLLAKSLNIPLYRFLGGPVREVDTDITISLDDPAAMAAKSGERVKQGFSTLKIKVGGDVETDLARLKSIRDSVGDTICIRIDANQGWTPKQAVQVGRMLERENIQVELMEQPCAAHDLEGLRFVRENCSFPVYADESMFSPRDALRLVTMKAVDGMNIKLMKCGGIYNAIKIAAIADTAGIPCLIGSMMECSVSVAAAAHLAASRRNIDKFDLDAPLFCSVNPARGGITYRGCRIEFPDLPGLGISSYT